MKVRGLAVLDRRTLAARHLLDWRAELIDDLGGEAATSAAQRALVEVATRTRLDLDPPHRRHRSVHRSRRIA